MKYEANETIRIIGGMTEYRLIQPGGVAEHDFKNVMQANTEGETFSAFELALDMFMLGTTYGKKLERSEKRGEEIKPLADPRDTVQELRENPSLKAFMETVLKSGLPADEIRQMIDEARAERLSEAVEGEITLERTDIRSIAKILNTEAHSEKAQYYGAALDKMADAMSHDDDIVIDQCVKYLHR